jgi:hypothetical protein
MTPEQKAVFINAQIQMMVVEKTIMDTENVARERAGEAPAYGPKQFEELQAKWEPVLGYNALISFFQD